MVHETRYRVNTRSHFLPANVITWVSAVIVMGILCNWFAHQNQQPDSIIYMLVVSILTVIFFLAAFFLEHNLAYLLLFNIIFSYLWLAVVVFAASMFSYASRQAQAVEAFSFIAFFALAFNVFYNWYTGFARAGTHTGHTTRTETSTVRV